jgi:hypothetical protein
MIVEDSNSIGALDIQGNMGTIPEGLSGELINLSSKSEVWSERKPGMDVIL